MKTHKLWIGTQPNPDDRLIIEVSERDYNKVPVRNAVGTVTIKDVNTKEHYSVRRASCGLRNCNCALELAN